MSIVWNRRNWYQTSSSVPFAKKWPPIPFLLLVVSWPIVVNASMTQWSVILIHVLDAINKSVIISNPLQIQLKQISNPLQIQLKQIYKRLWFKCEDCDQELTIGTKNDHHCPSTVFSYIQCRFNDHVLKENHDCINRLENENSTSIGNFGLNIWKIFR